jgi:hypothetical protein
MRRYNDDVYSSLKRVALFRFRSSRLPEYDSAMATQRKYTGYSGQMAVMAELLFQGCNAAVPVIDVSMDVFAFRDDRDEFARIQVKSAQGTPYKRGGGYRARFNLSLEQLRDPDRPPLYYALAVRLEDHWISFLVISRTRLWEYWRRSRPFPTSNPEWGEVALRLKYRPDATDPDRMRVHWGVVELTDCLSAWDQLPPLRPLSEGTSAGGPPQT